MSIEFDDRKRLQTLRDRGLDFARAAEVFAGRHYTAEDLRGGYREIRYITAGLLDGRLVVLVWAARWRAAHHQHEESQ